MERLRFTSRIEIEAWAWEPEQCPHCHALVVRLTVGPGVDLPGTFDYVPPWIPGGRRRFRSHDDAKCSEHLHQLYR